MTSTVPDMADLYRQLLGQLTTTFGGVIDEANADAIAYAAAELYHREFEPRLWQEKSAHDLLDLFGVPRAGVFAPYSLAERVVVFERRSRQADYVHRAHELLDSLGVPSRAEDGRDLSLQGRLESFLVGDSGPGVREAEEPAGEPPDEAVEQAPTDEQVPEDESVVEEGTLDGDEALGDDEALPDVEPDAMTEDEPVGEDEALPEEEAVDEGEGEEGEPKPEFGEELDVDVDVDVEPGAAPLVDAVRALERAARVEAELSQVVPGGPAGVDLVALAGTLNAMQVDLAALRELVDALGKELRERLEAIHEEVLTARGVLRPATVGGEPIPGASAAHAETIVLPPVDGAVDIADVLGAEVEPNGRRRSLRRILLIVILVVLGVVIAGVVVLIAIYGWDQVRSQVSGFATAAHAGRPLLRP